MNVLDLIEHQVRATPGASAILEDHRQLSDALLWQRSGDIAAGLRAAGQVPGSRVAVLMSRGIDWIVALLGVMRAGCVYLPLNMANPSARNCALVQQARVEVVLGPGSQELPRPRHLQFCEPSFDVHLFEVFHPLSLGGAVVIDPRPDFISFDHYVDRIERQGVDIISPPTTFWHLWRSRINEGRSRWPRGLKRIVVGGERAQPTRSSRHGMPEDLVLMNGYGPAETNYATVHRVTPADATRSVLPTGRARGAWRHRGARAAPF
jgi:non-ribosomal peptide synthetase component F